MPTFFFDATIMKPDAGNIEAIAARVAEEERVDLVDFVVAREGPRTIVRAFIDREGGVTLSDCESFSRKLGVALDVEDPIAVAYVLEVSSPGLNRRLTRPSHFAAATGKRARVSLNEPLEGSRNFVGTVTASDGQGIEMDCGGRAVRLPFDRIRKANIEVSQEELFGKGKGNRKK